MSNQRADEFETWISRLPGDSTIAVPDIIDYELRRELIRIGAVASIRRLDQHRSRFRKLPLTQSTLLRGASLWADARRAGRPTAHAGSIDIDVLFAASVLEAQELGEDAIVVTTNIRHLAQFVPCLEWSLH